MQSIGERLEEARKRRGISIREASEATKIRGDFLLKFENNQFSDVDLPEIYVRGFLRNYSGFLKIDPEKIVTDYNATLIGETKSSRRDSRELFGRLELPERPRPTIEGNEPQAPAGPRRGKDEAAEPGPRSHPARVRDDGPDMTGHYVKIGLIVVGGLAAVLAIVWLVMQIVNAAQGPTRANTDTPTPPVQNQAPTESITLIAIGDVWVKVNQVSDNALLFDGRLARGERKTIARRGAVRLAYNVGTNLQAEVNGQLFGMTSEGMGFSTIR